MLISLLLNHEGKLVAGGRASDQIPLGQNYWRRILGLPENCFDEFETAVVDVSDRRLANMILRYHADPSEYHLNSIMSQLEQPLQERRRVVVGRFAA